MQLQSILGQKKLQIKRLSAYLWEDLITILKGNKLTGKNEDQAQAAENFVGP